jgi:hypothetical protein
LISDGGPVDTVTMFLRRNTKKKNGTAYDWWTLVESACNARGIRQRIVATIGKLPGLDREERIGGDEIGRILFAGFSKEQMPLGRGLGRSTCGQNRRRCANRELGSHEPVIARNVSTKAHVIDFLLVAPEKGLDIAEAFSIRKLRETHTKGLIPTGKRLDLVLAPISVDAGGTRSSAGIP